MLDNQVRTLQTILSNEDLQDYAGDGFWNLIQTVVTSDPFSAMVAIKDIKDLIFHMPTILFWDKMKQYLLGTFHNRENQAKMARKFDSGENGTYHEFVKRQIHLVNSLDDDMKIDFFATLTRSFLLTELEQALFFKLSKFISICTTDELLFLKHCSPDFRSDNSVIVSSLYQYGLFVQETDDEADITYYKLSGFALALKQNSLNFNDGLNGATRIEGYGQMIPLSIPEPISRADGEAIWGQF